MMRFGLFEPSSDVEGLLKADIKIKSRKSFKICAISDVINALNR